MSLPRTLQDDDHEPMEMDGVKLTKFATLPNK